MKQTQQKQAKLLGLGDIKQESALNAGIVKTLIYLLYAILRIVPKEVALKYLDKNNSKLNFKTLDFDGKFLELIGANPSHNFYAICYANPKFGKSNFSYQFAKYMIKFGKVLYCASEEGISQTTKEKIIQNGLDKSDKVEVLATRELNRLSEKLKEGFAFVIIDSAQMLNLSSDDVQKLRKDNPDTAFLVILQVTKQGNFRGSQEWTHNCDCVIKFEDVGIASQNGRFGSGTYKVFE
ncbi:MAG: hypothetical protein OHK0038_20440 [Flammeovirgaceae bacterium]